MFWFSKLLICLKEFCFFKKKKIQKELFSADHCNSRACLIILETLKTVTNHHLVTTEWFLSVFLSGRRWSVILFATSRERYNLHLPLSDKKCIQIIWGSCYMLYDNIFFFLETYQVSFKRQSDFALCEYLFSWNPIHSKC